MSSQKNNKRKLNKSTALNNATSSQPLQQNDFQPNIFGLGGNQQQGLPYVPMPYYYPYGFQMPTNFPGFANSNRKLDSL